MSVWDGSKGRRWGEGSKGGWGKRGGGFGGGGGGIEGFERVE